MDRSSRRALPLVVGLIDDAGLFPPAALDLPTALARLRAELAAANPMLSGRFVCTPTHVAVYGSELAQAAVRLSIVVDGDDAEHMLPLERAARDFGTVIDAVELDARALADPAELERTMDAARQVSGVDELYVEVGWGTEFVNRIALVQRAGAAVKLRCGGVWESAFPAVAEVAGALTELARLGTPWKATAGLHSAVRGVDPRDGLVHHGFLNLLLAAEAATDGATVERVTQLVSTGDTHALVAGVRALSPAAIERTRASFVSYGSCDLREPLDDLIGLGLVERSATARPA